MVERGGIHAWGDESVRMSLPTPSYLLAASWSDHGESLDLSRLESIKPKGASKLHWMDMSVQLKCRSIAALSELPLVHTVVVASELVGRKQERARRKCLETLLPLLESEGVTVLTLESRGKLNDARDVDLLLALRRRGAVSRAIDIRHQKGSDEARLWVPDQILGAYAELELEKSQRLMKARGSWEEVSRSLTSLSVDL